MGLLDSVIGALGQPQGGGAGQGELLSAVVGMLAQGGQGGGLGDLVSRFEKGGLGPVISSWISTGQNLPVSADQLGSVLGPDVLSGLTQRTGLQGGDLLSQLSQVLPQVVDHLTPQGQVPQGGLGDVGAILGQLMRR